MTTKLAISLPDEYVAAARRAVLEGRATSVSGYIADSLSERIQHDQLTTLLAEMAAEAGAPTDDDRRWARSVLGLD